MSFQLLDSERATEMNNTIFNESTVVFSNPLPPWLHGTLYLLVGTMAVGGNILNILVLPKLTNYPDSAKRFMTVLAVNDFGLGVVLLAVAPCAWLDRWLWGERVCHLLGFLFFLFGGGGSTTLLLLNIDRYFAISKPFVHQRFMTDRTIAIICGCTLGGWFVFVQLCMTIETFLDNVLYDPVYRLCITQLQNLQGVYPFLLSFCLYFQSLVLIIIYIKIWRTSRKHLQRINMAVPSIIVGQGETAASNFPSEAGGTVTCPSDSSSPRRTRGSDTKAIRTTLLVTGFFILSYAPYSTSVVLNFLRVSVPPEINALVVIIAVCNTCWNTVVYSIHNKNFRQRLKRMIRR